MQSTLPILSSSGVEVVNDMTQPQCASFTSQPRPLRPVIFWYFTYLTSPPMANVTLCTPRISLHDVSVTVDLPSSLSSSPAGSPVGLPLLSTISVLGPLGSHVPLPYDAYESVPRVSADAPYNGLIFDHRHPEAVTQLARALARLQLDTALRYALAQQALAVRHTHSISSIAAQFLQEFARVVQEQTPQPRYANARPN